MDGVDCKVDLLDSDVYKFEDALRVINSYKSQMGFIEFGEMVEAEFHRVGFRAYVVWEFDDGSTVPQASLEFVLSMRVGPFAPPTPTISIVEKLDPSAREGFDHERMTWEVQNDILGIDGVKGSIGKSGLITPKTSTAFFAPNKG